MSSLADLQHALDLYGASEYWACVANNAATSSASQTLGDVLAVVVLLRERAAAAGCTEEQLNDAAAYGAHCAADRRRPLMAEVSFDEFCRVNGL